MEKMKTEKRREEIKAIVNSDDSCRQKLFFKGFLLSDDEQINCEDYPFFGKWKKTILENGMFVLSHPETKLTTVRNSGGRVACLIGHAFDPVSGKILETDLLQEVLKTETDDDLFDRINEWTGVYSLILIFENGIRMLNDPVGLQSVFYTSACSHFYASSHSNLIGDLLGLQVSSYVERLKRAPTFHFFGNQLPGNITQFSEVFRLNPNHYLTCGAVSVQKRFYHPKNLPLSEEEICDSLINIMTNTMKMIPQKWSKPAISLTGGCDSKTTLACAKAYWDKYRFFSYDSQKHEVPDMKAADTICKALSLDLIKYRIPYSDAEFDGIENLREIFWWNGGDILANNPNDVRKRVFLDRVQDFDIEVKSWASEVGRSRYTKHYDGRVNFGKRPSPRTCTTFYKFLFFNRILVNQTDRVFKAYLERYFEPDPDRPIPWQDQFYWEWHWPSRDGITLTCEQLFSNDITVPYNNRKILELLLSVPEEGRITDRIYARIRQKLEPGIDRACLGVTDANHTARRAKLENLYYIFNRLLVF